MDSLTDRQSNFIKSNIKILRLLTYIQYKQWQIMEHFLKISFTKL